MAAITVRFGTGHANLAPGGNQGNPSLVTVLRDIADDLANGQVATIASIDATDLAEVLTLANEIKASLNVVAGQTILTTKA